ncbi:hypothetical protein H7F51_05055 [Novosphingobium flavum]|uniref:Lipoprotein n=1 Tax=Novosphingobium flavum TaxID=1778672 RepID=A0A7X1FQ05_9SPHN|nr:hypothetical protein [Novosphingobium flavum]MBC2664879.1 hypothetical protein [Novosphingobium flavum]
MKHNWRRVAAGAAVVMLGLALSACLLTPGRFTSALDLRRDGRFSFTYSGEIRMLALSKLAEKAQAEKNAFTPSDCFDENMAKRPCKATELAEQRKTWDDERKASADRRARESEQMKALLGGIDPSSPAAAEELATRLRRQAGWKSVIYKGDGLYVVDFSLSGRLDHDFAFPTIERFPMANPFIQLTRRADGSVRVDAPGFGPASGAGNPFTAMMSGAMSEMGGAAGKAPALPTFDGTFTITTDGQVLANNTDEGPQPDPAGQRLAWVLNARSAAAPTALVRLGQ